MAPSATVIQSEKFKIKVAKIKLDIPRIEESIKGVIWILERSPEEGRKIPPPAGGKYRIIDIDRPIEAFPGLWIVYSLEKNVVTLLELNTY
jgi:hypothetical protein